jgi:hypothetical protein
MTRKELIEWLIEERYRDEGCLFIVFFCTETCFWQLFYNDGKCDNKTGGFRGKKAILIKKLYLARPHFVNLPLCQHASMTRKELIEWLIEERYRDEVISAFLFFLFLYRNMFLAAFL